jgi:hypothetical protein
MFNIKVSYPDEEEEFKIVEQTTATHTPQVDAPCTNPVPAIPPAAVENATVADCRLFQIHGIQEASQTFPEYQKCRAEAKVMAGTIALRLGGLSTAASHWTAPG